MKQNREMFSGKITTISVSDSACQRRRRSKASASSSAAPERQPTPRMPLSHGVLKLENSFQKKYSAKRPDSIPTPAMSTS